MEPLPPLDFPSTPVVPELASSPQLWMDRLQLLWDSRRLLYRTALWALIVGTVVAFLIPRRFESTVSIMPPDPLKDNGAMLAAMGGAAGMSPGLMAMAGSVLGVKSSGDLYLQLLRSRTVQDRLIDRFNLQKQYWARYKQDARRKLDRRTEIIQDRKSGVISLTFTDPDPRRSHDIAQAYVEELNTLLATVSTSSARRQRIFIEQRLITVKADLEDAEKQFSAFASKNTALDIKEQTRAMVESAAMLQGQMIAAESELQGLEQIYTPSNYRVRSAQARVSELRRQLEKLGGSDSSLGSDVTDSKELYPSIRKLPVLGVQWADLYRRMKIQETVYELLNQQYELARIQEAKEIPTIDVIDPANVPEKKSFPPRLLIIALLMTVSLAGAIVKIAASARIRSLHEDDPRRILAIHAGKRLRDLRNRVASLHTRRNGSAPYLSDNKAQ